ncbi:DUF2705 family protein [Terribacillus saccharophilus]|uniref:DUF2705 family protein n=1 Tax=Terribacillus saccharophilus TaxID=361277 RepID=UPI002989F6D7|nr:DUF2705 family protein [Terribacillus saccharophilus]MCM3225965.1 hypothetical protein [Terribacillus saccharophilus]
MQSHFYRILHNRKSLFIFILIILIPFIDVAQLLQMKIQYDVEYHPAFAFFLGGMTQGHAMQIMLIWFLPLFLLLLVSDDGIQDIETGYRQILISKVGRKNYLKEKMLTSFIIGFLSLFVSLLINFITVNILFYGGTYNNGLSDIQIPDNTLYQFSMAYPYLADILFTVIACFMAGVAGMLSATVSFFFRSRKFAYASAFFIWFLLVLRQDSLVFVFQPFTEYGFETIVPVLSISLLVCIGISFILYFIEVKYNEN